MKHKRTIVLVIVGALALVGLLLAATGAWAGPNERNPAAPQAPSAVVSNTISYQGQLLDSSGNPISGTQVLTFSLYAQASGGTRLWSQSGSVQVDDGLFHAHLNVTPALFDGQALWLGVQLAGEAEMTPRQPLLPVPYAFHALGAPWSGLSGIPAGFADGVDDVTAVVSGTNIFAGEGLNQASSGNSVTMSVYFAGSGGEYGTASSVARSDHDHDGSYWSLTGNAGTDPTINFLGTTDGVSLALAVSSTVALRLEPTTASPNLIGGHEDNRATPGVMGATIGGGGNSGDANRVTDHYGVVEGGRGNLAGNDDGDPANAVNATVSGGYYNIAGGVNATVGGGQNNTASGGWATIAGGDGNLASSNHATIGGGLMNHALGLASTIVGGEFNTTTVAAEYAVVVGGRLNLVTGTNATVSGGYYNIAGGVNATVGGGQNNTATGGWATIAGGDGNLASSNHVAIGGGLMNRTLGLVSTVAGGMSNTITVTAEYGVVGGGHLNLVTGTNATVSGGYYNIAGGVNATVGGGQNNTARGGWATIAGGDGNLASSNHAAIGGGLMNRALGLASTVAGGESNTAQGEYSFAAGLRAQANHQGTFVWGDSTDADITSPIADSFIVRANGGIWFGAATTDLTPTIGSGVFISTSTGAHLTTGGTWANSSDRERKENFSPVDGQEVLARLAELPISTWNYRTEDPSIRHMGPVAQDFYGAFGLGKDDRHISTVDADGVALAAIQGLYAQTRALEAENAAQQEAIDVLRQQNADLEARLAALEQVGTSRTLQLPGAWWLLGGLVAVAAVIGQRHYLGGRR